MSDDKSELKKINRKKKTGALIVAIVICSLLILFLSFLLFALFHVGLNAALPLLLIYAASVTCSIIGTVVVLVQRFKEIDKGEENEASKY